MKRLWLLFYLANWYAFAVAGGFMAMQHASGRWLHDLPWTSWGTEVTEALAGGDPVSGGALWLLLGAALAIVGVLASLVASLAWLADQEPASALQRNTPRQTHVAAPAPAAPLSPRAQEAADLVEDPRVRSLIQQLNTRLG